ncbi:MAG: DNA directed RNA polymerase, 7 kDa subunit [Podoviridae sp. ctg2L5]|nr:MAG: DNA directed RNA polymerase, 7 kDa subunit [Podoviridae sp. ctg2L5]
MRVELKELICKRCGHKWVARKPEVRVCPKCKSPYWDRKK